MPARFYAKFFDLLEKAVEDVGNGIRKVNGNGYSVYRIGATIRCDLKPEWIDGFEEMEASGGPSGQYVGPSIEPERRGGDV